MKFELNSIFSPLMHALLIRRRVYSTLSEWGKSEKDIIKWSSYVAYIRSAGETLEEYSVPLYPPFPSSFMEFSRGKWERGFFFPKFLDVEY